MSTLDFPNRLDYDSLLLDFKFQLPFPEPPARSVIGETEQKFLVGREEELEKLKKVYEQIVESGEPKLSIIQGRQGVGKSSLISWFVKKSNEEREKSVIVIPIETDESGVAFDFKTFYQLLIRSLWTKRHLEWVGIGSFVKILEIMEKRFSDKFFNDFLPNKLGLEKSKYYEIKNNPEVLIEVSQKDLRFLDKFWSLFEMSFHSIKDELPSMDFDLLICLWYSTLNNVNTFKAKRALEGKSEFEGFKIATSQDAKHYLRELIKIVRWLNDKSVFLIVIDHLEAGMKNPELVYNSLFSLLLQLRQLNYLFIIISGTYDAFHAIDLSVKDDMNNQIMNWSLNNVIYLNPLKPELAIQIVYTHLNNFWRQKDLSSPVQNPLYPFGEEALIYLYEITDRDLRKTLEILYYKVYHYRQSGKVKPIVSLFDAFIEFRQGSKLELNRQERQILMEKLLDPRTQDSIRSKQLEKQLYNLLTILKNEYPVLSNIRHEPNLDGLKPDLLLECGKTLGELRKVAIEIKIYRKGKYVGHHDVTKTHALLLKRLVDYVVWFSNRPLHFEEKYNLPEKLIRRVGRTTELTEKELGYVGLIAYYDKIFDKDLTPFEVETILEKAGLNIREIIDTALSLPPISSEKIEVSSSPSTTNMEAFLETVPETGRESLEKSISPSDKVIPETSSAQEKEIRIIGNVILENSGKKYVYAKTIVKQLKKKGLDLEERMNFEDAINYVLNIASQLGYKTSTTRINFY